MEDILPYITDEPLPQPKKVEVTFPIPNLIDEIADDANISESFDYVASHLECPSQRENVKKKKDVFVKCLKEELSTGTFRIHENDFRTLYVEDGPKGRIVQSPKVYHRCGCHTIMVPFEKYTYPTLIKNTAASIKERGMHWLHQILEEDLLADPSLIDYYQCDLLGYYDNISQPIMMSQVREYTSDRLALGMLDNFICLLPKGLSKGLRSSQCLANLHLNKIDHLMCEKVSYHEIELDDGEIAEIAEGVGVVIVNGKEIRYHYYRYCDDIVILGRSKKELWELRNYLKGLLSELGLTIKNNEAVRPISVGIDFLGYVTYVDDSNGKRAVYSYIRKRTKQKFARRIGRVKSRKRRQSLIGSFFGMAAHCDSRHLLKKLITPTEFRKLKHTRKMKEYGDFKIKPTTLDGKKNFRGTKVSSQELDGKGFIIYDYEKGVVPTREREEYERRLQSASAQGVDLALVPKPKTKYVIGIIFNGQLRKLWTGDKEIWQILDHIQEDGGLPFFTSLKVDYSGQYKRFDFARPSALGLPIPSDEELEALVKKLCITL